MDYKNIMAIMSELYHKSRYLISEELNFKWELSRDIIDILQTNTICYYLVHNSYENMTLYGYPVDVNYLETNCIKLWCEVK